MHNLSEDNVPFAKVCVFSGSSPKFSKAKAWKPQRNQTSE